MSRHVRTRSEWKIILEEQESAQPVGPMVDEQPSDKQLQQKESPTESEDVTPDQKKGDAGAPEVQGTDIEADFQELAHPETEGKGKDDPDIHEKNLPKLESSEIPEEGPEPEAVLQEQDQPETGDEDIYGSDINCKISTELESVYVPERDPDPEIDLPDLAQPETWGEDTDDPHFKWEISPKPEPVYMPEAGEGKPPV
uniref:GAGE domain-containing protein n=1 Tax=Molossus molossus TaxID=27622 RepID=A0A7J8J6I5_MOLMO|nr:hypothetical protein HJG59_009666 [Molossus molossus]